MKGIVFDVQSFAIYDGPGIRTAVFFKGCPLRCAWCQNPESQRREPEMGYFRDRCQGCGTCVEVCPNQALRLTHEGVIRHRERCVSCGKCAEACPEKVMERIGNEMSPQEMLNIVSKDRPFFESSGGGVTITGGEPTLQADYLVEVLDRLRNAGLHTALETCGFFKEELVDRLVPLVDLFLYDLKHTDPALHKQFTGVDTQRIARNFISILHKKGQEGLVARVPLVPGFNTDSGSMQGIIDFLKRAGYTGPVHLMPYNTLTRTKYEKIGRPESYRNMGSLDEEDLQRISTQVKQNGFEPFCNH